MSGAALLERVSLPAGTALVFIDGASGLPVRDGLISELRSLADDKVLACAVISPSGTHHWPGLSPRIAQALPPSPTQPRRLEWRVRDAFERFMPLRIGWPLADAPADPPAPRRVSLCSAPGRVAPDGSASIQACLVDGAQKPAAWARVVATGGSGAPTVGMSDAQGRLVVHLPFPRPERRNGHGNGAAPAWPAALVTLRFEYDPAVAAEADARRVPAPRLDLWLAQPEVRAQASLGTGDALAPVFVECGTPTVLRTAGLPPLRSELRLVPL